MRVLHVVATPQRRGAEVFASDLVRALALPGIEQRVVVLHENGHGMSFDAPVTTVTESGPTVPGLRVRLGKLRRVADVVSAWRPDVVQVHGGEPLKYALFATRRGEVPVVYRRIGTAPPQLVQGARRVAHGRLMRRAAKVVTVAEALRREAIETFRVPAARVVTIPNAVDARRLAPSKSRMDVRRSLHIQKSATVILSVGALSPEKDPIAHLEVTRRALATGRDIVHLFVGDGPGRASLDRAIRGAGVPDRVRVLGSRADVADLLASGDLILLASHSEGLPGCLIEGALAGLPAAAYDVGGVSEIVHDAHTGFLVQRGDVAALTAATLRLIDDPESRIRMGEQARTLALKAFTIDRIATRYVDVYEATLRSGGLEVPTARDGSRSVESPDTAGASDGAVDW